MMGSLSIKRLNIILEKSKIVQIFILYLKFPIIWKITKRQIIFNFFLVP